MNADASDEASIQLSGQILRRASERDHRFVVDVRQDSLPGLTECPSGDTLLSKDC
jgi:hypothetical protein